MSINLILTGTLSVYLLVPIERATEMCVGNIMCNYNPFEMVPVSMISVPQPIVIVLT